MKLSDVAIAGGILVVGVVGAVAVKELIEFQQRRADEAAAVAYYQEDRTPQALAKYMAAQEIARQATPKQITHALYMSIRTGMRRGEVFGILGPGTETARNDLSGLTTVMYQWVNSDGSNMNVMLQNDSVIQKAQFGLR